MNTATDTGGDGPHRDWTPADPATGGRAAWDECGRRNKLLPPELFSDEPAPAESYWDWTTFSDDPGPPRTGAESPALAAITGSCCAGWRTPPTGAEMYEAIHAETPTTRQEALIKTLWVEGTFDQIMEAWAQRAYTFRQLVRAVHAAGYGRTEEPHYAQRMRTMNFWAAP